MLLQQLKNSLVLLSLLSLHNMIMSQPFEPFPALLLWRFALRKIAFGCALNDHLLYAFEEFLACFVEADNFFAFLHKRIQTLGSESLTQLTQHLLISIKISILFLWMERPEINTTILL